MEVLDKENVKENETKDLNMTNPQKFTYIQIQEIDYALDHLLRVCQNISINTAAKLLFVKAQTEDHIQRKISPKTAKILDKYVKTDKNGNRLTTQSNGQTDWDYKRKKDKELYNKENIKMLSEHSEVIDLITLSKVEYKNINISIFMPGMMVPGQEPTPAPILQITQTMEKYIVE